VAWLRRLGMPLAQIGAVTGSPPAEAAALVTTFQVVRRLITLANEAGGPDNIACALADITEAA
jgi:hypothetical protein